MSFVGPRPNVKRETDLYTLEEKALLSVSPGITDLASIIFSDEGEILSNSQDPVMDYNQLIGVIGSGTMGNGIAHVSALSGYSTILMDIKDEFIQKGLNTIQNPYITNVFNCVGFRDFSFSFN